MVIFERLMLFSFSFFYLLWGDIYIYIYISSNVVATSRIRKKSYNDGHTFTIRDGDEDRRELKKLYKMEF